MSSSKNTFATWKDRVKQDPEAAANHLHTSITALPKKVRRAVISSLPSLDTLKDNFRAAHDYLDKPLGGIPYFLKDLFDVAGYPTQCGSQFLSEVRPDPEESCALHNSLTAQGAVFGGKTQMNEFAYGLDGTNPHFGDCPHPRDPGKLSGGSSSGSAWAVACGLVPFAFGSDTGGSIRVPAAFCGLFGLRLEPDKWGKDGFFPLSPTYDTPGWFTANPMDMKTSILALLDPNLEVSVGQGLYLEDLGVPMGSMLRSKYREIADALNLKETSPQVD